MDANSRGAQMMSWDTTQVFNFLTNQNISSKNASILKDFELNGTHLSTFTLRDFIELETNIPRADLINIRNIRDKYLSGGLVTKNKERQVPRKFGEPVSSDLKYKLGSILPPENTNYSNEEPIREFKEFSLGKLKEMKEQLTELKKMMDTITSEVTCITNRSCPP
nr:uncharacterized protein LOC124814912 [Hydra vulgaris]